MEKIVAGGCSQTRLWGICDIKGACLRNSITQNKSIGLKVKEFNVDELNAKHNEDLKLKN